jgi:hypothetical protein
LFRNSLEHIAVLEQIIAHRAHIKPLQTRQGSAVEITSRAAQRPLQNARGLSIGNETAM